MAGGVSRIIHRTIHIHAQLQALAGHTPAWCCAYGYNDSTGCCGVKSTASSWWGQQTSSRCLLLCCIAGDLVAVSSWKSQHQAAHGCCHRPEARCHSNHSCYSNLHHLWPQATCATKHVSYPGQLAYANSVHLLTNTTAVLMAQRVRMEARYNRTDHHHNRPNLAAPAGEIASSLEQAMQQQKPKYPETMEFTQGPGQSQPHSVTLQNGLCI